MHISVSVRIQTFSYGTSISFAIFDDGLHQGVSPEQVVLYQKYKYIVNEGQCKQNDK